MTPRELAAAYVATINGPANGWGQFVHPVLGRTDRIMMRLTETVGGVECDHLLDEAFAEASRALELGRST
jgi:hypothetical protein